MAYTKVGPFVDGGAPYLSAANMNTLEAGILASSYDTGVYPEGYVQTGDAGDWALAITRALAYATPLGLPVRLQSLYAVKTTVALNTGDTLIGFGPSTGLQTPTNAPIVAIAGTSKSNLTLQNFTVDGNCLTLGTKSSIRSVRFISCTNVRVNQLTTLYNPDWACSFEQCTNVTVTTYTHRAGTATLTGGRDGIHFLDCNDVVLDGAKIHSGDDCVGITSQTQNISRITVRNVTGVSETAAVVTVGNESTSAFTASDITIENISTYTSPDYGGICAYVVKVRAQNASVCQRVRLANVTGQASSHGIWFDGNTTNPITDVILSGINTVSTTNHGIYLNRISQFEGHGLRGTSTAGLYDGINCSTSTYGSITGAARNCSLWGLQINACTSIDVTGFVARDNGANNFSATNGGNGRIVNSTDIYVNGGQFVGSTSVSYYGLAQAGNTTTVVSTNTRIGGAH